MKTLFLTLVMVLFLAVSAVAYPGEPIIIEMAGAPIQIIINP